MNAAEKPAQPGPGLSQSSSRRPRPAGGLPGGVDASLACEPALVHLDMDAFFAACEVRDDPSLAGRPVVVGGAGPRGVVASASYEARRFGVRSAMPSSTARRLCPEALFVPPNFDRYRAASEVLQKILLACTPLVEPLGLDEAFLDVTGSRRLLGTPREIAVALRERVRDELALPCSVGVARTKLVAKLASEAAKPSPGTDGLGVVVVTPNEEQAFLRPMAVEALWGVGPATARVLRSLGLATVGDLAAAPPEAVLRRLGKSRGRQVLELAAGVDPRPVVARQAPKSLSHERTFPTDVYLDADVKGHAARLAEAVGAELERRQLVARTVTLKVRFSDFSTLTRSSSRRPGHRSVGEIHQAVSVLVASVERVGGVRLLGISASGLSSSGAEQLPLPFGHQNHEVVDWALGAVRERFGVGALGRGPAITRPRGRASGRSAEASRPG